MTRPLRRDAERNRQRILAAARTLIAEKGLGVSHEEIARVADVAVGTVYNRFPTKEQLFDALYGDQVDEVVALAQGAREIADPWAALTTFLNSILALQAGNRGLRQLLAGTSNQLGLASRARELITPISAELVARAQAAGALRDDVGVVDLSLVPIMVGAIIDSAREVDPELWRRALGILLDGLRSAAATPLPVGPPTVEQFDRILGGVRPAPQP